MNDHTTQLMVDMGEVRTDIKHIKEDIERICSTRMWVITIGASIGGIAGLIKIFQTFFP